MNSDVRLLGWIFGSFLAALATAVAVIIIFGAGERGTIEALRATARLSFLLFFMAYVGNVFGRLRSPLLASLGRLRREFGLGFAASHLVHVGLIVWLLYVAQRLPLPTETIVLDGIGLVWVYVLATFSFNFFRRRLSPKSLRIIFNVGLEFIALVFLTDFLLFPLVRGAALSITYLPFTFLLIFGFALRRTHLI